MDNSKSRLKEKMEPAPSVLQTSICPPINFTRSEIIERPSPVPPNSLVVEESPCEKGLNNFSWLELSMPMTVSNHTDVP